MPVLDPAAIAGILADLAVNIVSYAGIAALLYAIGGILIRTVSWTFDKLLITFIGSFYKYFEIIINGELLSDSVVKGMMDRVYLLVGVFVVFRLGMLLFNYMLNPSEVMDEKVGVNALIKRVILGLILIIFMPNIFGFAFRIQEAILKDQVIERIIMPDTDMEKVMKYKEKHGVGKIIGMTVFNGFFNVAGSAGNDKKVNTAYVKAMKIDQNYDLSVIDNLGEGIGGGILYESNGEYAFDYFPIFSTIVLGFVLYLLIQYCLDAVVRSFKLSVLQVIAPVCIVEYMINGDRNEVFKSWRKSVIATFAMLFMRVASIWFVAYVAMLMQPGSGVETTSLLAREDYLLKAIIVLGLLAFMMDFPKMMSDVFGLDLDQSGSVKNVMGKAMGAAVAGLAVGGAVAGMGMKAAGATKGTLKGGLTSLAGKDSSFAKGLNNPFKTGAGQIGALAGNAAAGVGALAKSATKGGSVKSNYAGIKSSMNSAVDKAKNSEVAKKASEVGKTFADAAKENHLGTTLKTGAIATGAAILASNSVTKSASGGYQQTAGAVDSKISSKEEKAATAAYRSHQMQAADATLEQQQNINIKLGVNENIDSVDVVSRANGLSDFSTADTVMGNLQNMNRTMDVTRDTVVNINDNVQSVVNTTNDISRNVQTAVNTTQTIAQNTDTIVNSTNNISQNTDTIVNNTNNISQNTDTLVNQTEHISHQVDNIEDNTFYSGVDSINNMENSGYVDKPIKSLNDSNPKPTTTNQPNNNDEIETL